jgi:hypothetical protein
MTPQELFHDEAGQAGERKLLREQEGKSIQDVRIRNEREERLRCLPQCRHAADISAGRTGVKTFVAVPCSDGVWDCSYELPILPREKEVTIMNWEAPSFVEVKMDSEINSYQDDFKDLSEAQEQPPEAVISTDNE